MIMSSMRRKSAPCGRCCRVLARLETAILAVAVKLQVMASHLEVVLLGKLTLNSFESGATEFPNPAA